MSQITDFKCPSSAGTCQIHARQWLPDTTPYPGIVQLVHGIAEHIARYDAFARFLNAQGYIVVGNDHLGHGSSMARPENPGYFADREGWTHVSNDVRTLQILTMRHFPNLPYFLFGHSMGAGRCSLRHRMAARRQADSRPGRRTAGMSARRQKEAEPASGAFEL